MMTLPSFRQFMSLSGLACALAGAVTAPASAQIRTEGRNLQIAYQAGGPSRNGYADAQVEVTYYFGVCAGQVAFLASYNPVPRMLVGNHRYWLDGRQVEVPPQIAPPRLAPPVIRGTVRGNNTSTEISFIHATSSGLPSCSVNALTFGPSSNFWPAGTPEDRQRSILAGFGLDQRGTLPPLRNPEVEAHFRQIIASERTDSLNRTREAESRRLAARRDSIARAEAQRGAPAGGAGAATGTAAGTATATTGTAAGAGLSTASTSAGGARPRELTVEEREAAARAAEREAEAKRQEEFRRQQEARAEKARQDSVMVQQGAEAIVAVGTAVAPAVDKMFTALEGTGFTMGMNFSTSYLPGDAGRMGGTLGWAHPTSGSLLGFFDFSFELGSSEENVAATEGVALTVGAPIPRMKLPVGRSVLRPHLGITFLKTAHPDENFGLGVDRQLLMLGFIWSGDGGGHIRFESTIWEGKPTFGFALMNTLQP